MTPGFCLSIACAITTEITNLLKLARTAKKPGPLLDRALFYLP